MYSCTTLPHDSTLKFNKKSVKKSTFILVPPKVLEDSGKIKLLSCLNQNCLHINNRYTYLVMTVSNKRLLLYIKQDKSYSIDLECSEILFNMLSNLHIIQYMRYAMTFINVYIHHRWDESKPEATVSQILDPMRKFLLFISARCLLEIIIFFLSRFTFSSYFLQFYSKLFIFIWSSISKRVIVAKSSTNSREVTGVTTKRRLPKASPKRHFLSDQW